MKKLGFNTLALHYGHTIDQTMSRAVPLYRTTSYLFKSAEHAENLFNLKEEGYIYTRLGNPTQDVLEKRMAILENGKAAVAVSSGTSAIYYTIINVCKEGDEIVSSSKLYGGTYTMFNDILPHFGIKVNFVDPLDPINFDKAITKNTKLIFTETIGNPTLDVSDIEQISKIAKKHHIPLVVDSTFTPPSIFRPLEYGANIVVHSLTKWIGGHGTAIGGIVVDGGNFDWTDPKFKLFLVFSKDLGENNNIAFAIRLRFVPLRNLGAAISPDNAWIFLQGLETLSLRMERHCKNAIEVARFLSSHPKVEWVRYPGIETDPCYNVARKYFNNGFGGMVVFGIKGGRSNGGKFIENLKIFSHLANVGDAKSLAIHPATTTHSQLTSEQLKFAGLSESLIRLSIGIEDIDDILWDIEQSLNNI